jgi:predicted ATP-grasp superfamily ATP-dependent carboligase
MMLPNSTEVYQLSDLEDCDLDMPMMIKPSREVSETRGRQFNSLVTEDKEVLRTTVSELI